MRHNKFVNKKGLGNRVPDNKVIQESLLGEIKEKADEWKRLRNDVPFSYLHGIIITTSFPVCNKFNLIPS